MALHPGSSTTTAAANPTGFMGIFKYWPDTAHWTLAKNAAASAAHPWLKGARFYLASESICQTGAPSANTWDADIANVAVDKTTFPVIMTRMSCPPAAAFDPTTANSITYMDAMVAGAVSVMNSVGTTHLQFDAENYSTATMLFNYGVGLKTLTATCSGTTLTVSANNSATIAVGTYINIPGIAANTKVTAMSPTGGLTGTGGNGTYTIDSSQTVGSGTAGTFGVTQISNPGALTRAQMAVKMQDLGRQFGLSLWSRIPNATVYLFFGATQNMAWAGAPSGTQMPAAQADATYAANTLYNMYPYFCLGLLDACPSTGMIVDYCEGGCYGFPGLAALKRVLYASNNWVSVYFPTYTGLIAKCATNWRAVPILYPDCYFKAKGTWYAGANFTSATAGAFVTGKSYKILVPGNTDYTLVGAANSTAGTIFTATGPGTGTGTAYCLTDQAAQFTRNAVYALQCTPAGYLPGVYTDSDLGSGVPDPWGQVGAVIPIEPLVGTCLNDALAIYNGSATWASKGINQRTLYNLLLTAFASRTDYMWECQ